MTDLRCVYERLRERARQIASRFPPADFYRDHAGSVLISRRLFESDPMVVRLRAAAGGRLEDDFGHGVLHATKVALDAGALTHIEGTAAGYTDGFLMRRICIAHCAGLLHDVQRKQKNHAAKGASEARRLLAVHAVSPAEVEDICIAIRNHEAFTPPLSVNTREGALLSDCLYDADKFRWGPDNFTDTLWSMLSFKQLSLTDFLQRYPAGMESLKRIRATFRTASGRRYGPQFIDQGLAIGEELYRVVCDEFGVA